jgi:hypothetical protein
MLGMSTVPGNFTPSYTTEEIADMLRDLPQPAVEVSSEAAALIAALGGTLCFGIGMLVGVML